MIVDSMTENDIYITLKKEYETDTGTVSLAYIFNTFCDN